MANLQKIEVSTEGSEGAILLVNENTARKLTQDQNYLRQYVATLKSIGVLKSNLGTNVESEKPVSQQSRVTTTVMSDSKDMVVTENSQNSKKSESTDNTSEWNRSATVLLISTRIEMESDFQKPTQKSKLWNKISCIMKEHGYNFGAGECHAKWRNLMVTYRKNVDKSKQSGASSIRWEHYNILHEVYGNKVNRNPPDLCVQPSLKTCIPTYESPLLQQEIIPEETSFQTSVHKRRRTSDEPPEWFQKYLQNKEEEEKRKAEKEEQRWQQLREIENKKIETMKELTDLLKKFLEK